VENKRIIKNTSLLLESLFTTIACLCVACLRLPVPPARQTGIFCADAGGKEIRNSNIVRLSSRRRRISKLETISNDKNTNI